MRLDESVEGAVAEPDRPVVVERLVPAQLEQALDRFRSGVAAEFLAKPAGCMRDRHPGRIVVVTGSKEDLGEHAVVPGRCAQCELLLRAAVELRRPSGTGAGASRRPRVRRPEQTGPREVYWPKYLAGWIDNIAPGAAQQFMYFVGAVEILAGVLVLLKPRYAAYILAAWLAGIVVNLWSSRAGGTSACATSG